MNTKQESNTLPTFFISHGGGPCFWMDWGPTDPFKGLATFFKNFAKDLGRKPDAILVISATGKSKNLRFKRTQIRRCFSITMAFPKTLIN